MFATGADLTGSRNQRDVPRTHSEDMTEPRRQSTHGNAKVRLSGRMSKFKNGYFHAKSKKQSRTAVMKTNDSGERETGKGTTRTTHAQRQSGTAQEHS